MKRILLALLGCLAVASVGCSGSSLSSPPSPVAPPACEACPYPVEFETLYHGCLGIPPRPHPAQMVIDNQEDLEAIWAQYVIPDPVPAVDFSAWTVIAMHGPMRCSKCGSVEVVSVIQREDCTEVMYYWQEPCNDCFEPNIIWDVHIISVAEPGASVCYDVDCTTCGGNDCFF